MADQLSRVFQALADPTRRDLVARLAADGDATVGALAAPYDVSRPGGLQAPQGARGGRAGESHPGRPAPAGPPRGGGLRPDDEVDRALSAAGRGALPPTRPAAAGRECGRSRASSPTPTPKEQHHDHVHHARDQHRGGAGPAGHHHHPRVRCPARARSSAPTSIPTCSCSGSDRTASTPPSRCGTPAPAARGATPPVGRPRASRWGSGARSTRSGPTSGSCRPSPSRARPTGSAWRR